MAKDKKKKKGDEQPVPTGPWPTPRMKTMLDEEIAPKLAERFGITNPLAMPRLDKIVLNVNMGRHLEGTKIPPNIRKTVVETLETISGQKPVVVKAKRSVSNFKVRAGYETSAMVTLRRDRMWHFLDRLVHLATPRIRDFRGLPAKSFDQQGNYSMGLTEQGVFPEINMAEVSFTHGMNITLCFAGSNPERSEFVLRELGMPLKKDEDED